MHYQIELEKKIKRRKKVLKYHLIRKDQKTKHNTLKPTNRKQQRENDVIFTNLRSKEMIMKMTLILS